MPEKLLYSTSEACALLNIGKTKLFELKANGELLPTYIGSSLLFAADDLADFVQRRRAAQPDRIDELLELIDGDGRLDVARIPEGVTLADLEAAKRAIAERVAVA